MALNLAMMYLNDQYRRERNFNSTSRYTQQPVEKSYKLSKVIYSAYKTIFLGNIGTQIIYSKAASALDGKPDKLINLFVVFNLVLFVYENSILLFIR